MAITVTVIISVIFGSTIYFNNPGLNQAWSAQQQQQQKDKGFAVVGGVHSPEFQFEKNYTNVKNAVKSGINRPVISAGMSEMNHTRITTTMKLNANNSDKLTNHNS